MPSLGAFDLLGHSEWESENVDDWFLPISVMCGVFERNTLAEGTCEALFVATETSQVRVDKLVLWEKQLYLNMVTEEKQSSAIASLVMSLGQHDGSRTERVCQQNSKHRTGAASWQTGKPKLPLPWCSKGSPRSTRSTKIKNTVDRNIFGISWFSAQLKCDLIL